MRPEELVRAALTSLTQSSRCWPQKHHRRNINSNEHWATKLQLHLWNANSSKWQPYHRYAIYLISHSVNCLAWLISIRRPAAVHDDDLKTHHEAQFEEKATRKIDLFIRNFPKVTTNVVILKTKLKNTRICLDFFACGSNTLWYQTSTTCNFIVPYWPCICKMCSGHIGQ